MATVSRDQEPLIRAQIGSRQPPCSPCRSIFYFTCLAVSMGAVGVGAYNILVDPPQIMLTIAKYTLPSIGVVLFANTLVGIKNVFSPREVVVLSESDVKEQRPNVDAAIEAERRAFFNLIRKIAIKYQIAVPRSRSPMNEVINEQLGSIAERLERMGIVWNNYTALNQMLDELLAAYKIDCNVGQLPQDQQATIKLKLLTQFLTTQPVEDEFEEVDLV